MSDEYRVVVRTRSTRDLWLYSKRPRGIIGENVGHVMRLDSGWVVGGRPGLPKGSRYATREDAEAALLTAAGVSDWRLEGKPEEE